MGYLNRVRIVNDALSVFVAPFDVTLDEIDFSPLGEVKIEGLSLSPKNSSSTHPLATIPEIHLTYDFGELRKNKKIKNLQLKQPELFFDQLHLDALANKSGSSEAATFDLSTLAIFTESLSVTNGIVEIDLEGLPHIKTGWDFESPPLEFDDDHLTLNPIVLTLNEVEVKNLGNFGGATATVRVSRDLNTIDVTSITIDGTHLEITPEFLSRFAKKSETNKPDSTGSIPPPNPVELRLRQLVVGASSIRATGFDGGNDFPAFPDVSFDTQFDGEDLLLSNNSWSSSTPINLTVKNLAIGEGKAALISIDSLDFFAESATALIHEREVSRIDITGLDAIASDNSLAGFITPNSPTGQAKESSSDTPWKIKHLEIADGSLILADLTINKSTSPRIESHFDAQLNDLHFGPDGFESDGNQTIQLEQTRITAPGLTAADEPLVEINRSEFKGRWSEFNFDNTIRQITLQGPSINLTDNTLGEWLHPLEMPAQTGPVNRPTYKVENLKVTGGKLTADSKFARGKVPKIYSDFNITTLSGEDTPPYSYRLALQSFRLRNHPVFFEFEGPPAPPSLSSEAFPSLGFSPVAEEDVATIREIEVLATAEDLQRTRSIERIKLTGAMLRIGEGLKSIVDTSTVSVSENTSPPPTGSDPIKNADAPPPQPAWMVEMIELTQSQVRFETLIPQVEGLEFAIETRLEKVPFSAEGILSQDTLQKVELANIEIKDPYNSFITVAELPTIFVEFSLAGIAQQQVKKIDLINPSLYVGQGLFWWIDYQRNFRAQNEGASIGLEEGGPITGTPPTEIPIPPETALSQPDWVIDTITASAGKIIIAPTGVPIGMVPFPFNATTNMRDGGIELKLNIPGEDYVYEFPDYKVNLYGITGDVEFNVPVQQVNNNIVQTFTLKRAVWKDFEADDLFLTVTFDSEGVYGELGGSAYDGYVNGQFNFYLNDPGKWDAWITGSDFDTGPLTEVIIPDNFLMEGGLSLKIISEGRNKALGKTTGEFAATTPGWFDVTKFDKILEELPPEWTNLQRSLTELGLIALKRFDYDQGTGNLSLQGQEGEMKFLFSGDYGTRELNLHLHDKRNIEKNGETTTVAGPAPEAAARPATAHQ